MKSEVFRFKYFEVSHSQSSMKVGVDAVLLGAWAGEGVRKEKGEEIQPIEAMDVGCGCGIISLMIAQRFKDSKVLGIDIDPASIEESNENFIRSAWGKRMIAKLISFPDELRHFENKFDLIVSNPPFFKSGIEQPATQREKARHQDKLSIFSLIENAQYFLKPHGILSIIYPIEFLEEALELASLNQMKAIRICRVRDSAKKEAKRVLLELSLTNCIGSEKEESEIILFEKEREPTEDYKKLCRDFYLKF